MEEVEKQESEFTKFRVSDSRTIDIKKLPLNKIKMPSMDDQQNLIQYRANNSPRETVHNLEVKKQAVSKTIPAPERVNSFNLKQKLRINSKENEKKKV